MVQTKAYNTSSKPGLKERQSIINFLFEINIENIQEFGDQRSDIEKCIAYALKETTTFGGFVLAASTLKSF